MRKVKLKVLFTDGEPRLSKGRLTRRSKRAAPIDKFGKALMSAITLLHVSDVHFGIDDPHTEQKLLTDRLISSVRGHVINSKRRPPQLCIFSGDLTQRGSEDEYKKGEEWLRSLIEPFEECQLFIVPGNHEVQRPKDLKEPKRMLRSSRYEDVYNDWRARIGEAQLLTRFFNWHKNARQRLPVSSNWERSKFACHSKTSINAATIHLIGLNTAILSCDNDDRERLIADISALNNYLVDIKTDTELAVVVSHHPIKVNSTIEQWLMTWNDDLLRSALLQANGPHIYLYGHLHTASGTTMSQITGQRLTSFGAGAAYPGASSKQYPMKYAFYDINFHKGEIKPWTYEYNTVNGMWEDKVSESYPITAALPQLSAGVALPSKTSRKSGIALPSKTLRKGAKLTNVEANTLKVENAFLREDYEYSIAAAFKIINELFIKGKRPQHYFKSVTSRQSIDTHGDGRIIDTYTVRAKDIPVQVWVASRWIDDEAPEMPFLSQLNLKVSDLGEGTDVMYLPITNRGRQKELCIFFIPPINPGDERTVEISYQWPGYMRHLLSGAKVLYEWSFNTIEVRASCKIDLKIGFHPDIGQIEAFNESTRMRTQRLKPEIDEKGIRWWGLRKTIPLAAQDVYRLSFRKV